VKYWACLEIPLIDREWDICPDCLEALQKWIATPPKKKRSNDMTSQERFA